MPVLVFVQEHVLVLVFVPELVRVLVDVPGDGGLVGCPPDLTNNSTRVEFIAC